MCDHLRYLDIGPHVSCEVLIYILHIIWPICAVIISGDIAHGDMADLGASST